MDELTPFEIPFFENSKQLCKVYNDGGHFIAIPCNKNKLSKPRSSNKNTLAREIFEECYKYTKNQNLSYKDTFKFIKDNLTHLFDDKIILDEFITSEIKRKIRCMHMRKIRFIRKANLNEWSHFVTITYNDEIHDENTFRQVLSRCLSNLHTRKKWNYMGVFERAPETNRLHFHSLMYIPENEMVGSISEKKDYSLKQQKMQTTQENDFFLKRFGRNDFSKINADEIKYGGTLKYLLKYIYKTGEKIVYSRGIPSEIIKKISESDIATEMQDYTKKYILFDDVML